jgi:hypothetical protein
MTMAFGSNFCRTPGAGAIAVNITIEAAEANASPCVVTIQDDGGGIENFQSLVTLGKSDWSAATEAERTRPVWASFPMPIRGRGPEWHPEGIDLPIRILGQE